MILLREIKTGISLGIFDSEKELEEEYHFEDKNYNLHQRLKKVSRGIQDYAIFKVADFLMIALYMSEQEAIDYKLLMC